MPSVIDVTDRPVYALGPSTFRTVTLTGIAAGGGVGSPALSTILTVTGVASAGSVGSPSVTASMAVTGISAGPGGIGSPSLTVAVAPTGVAGSGGLGSPATVAKVPVNGIGSSSAAGEPTAFTSMNVAGIDAATGAVGEPRLNLVMSPAGVAGTNSFGDVGIVATVFIIPGPIDPSNDFGDAVVTKRGWVFRNPTIQLGWRFQKRYEGVSLLKENGVWVEVSHPDLERTKAAQKYLPGGHDHVVSDSLKADLIAAGYTVTDELVSTEVYES